MAKCIQCDNELHPSEQGYCNNCGFDAKNTAEIARDLRETCEYALACVKEHQEGKYSINWGEVERDLEHIIARANKFKAHPTIYTGMDRE